IVLDEAQALVELGEAVFDARLVAGFRRELPEQYVEAGEIIDVEEPREQPHLRARDRVLAPERRRRKYLLAVFGDGLALDDVKTLAGVETGNAAGRRDQLIGVRLHPRDQRDLILQSLGADLDAVARRVGRHVVVDQRHRHGRFLRFSFWRFSFW